MQKLSLIFLFPFWLMAQKPNSSQVASWQRQAQKVEITRDQWGVPHINGKTDADAVFGLMYAQCEDDFMRVEMNYIEKLGRLSEINGEKDLFNDLQNRILLNHNEAKQEYTTAQPWLKKLLNAHADGINYFLFTHPHIKPALLKHFEPWFPLLWTDGSIGAISTANLTVNDLETFYGKPSKVSAVKPKTEDEFYQQTGSNGFAIAPTLSLSGNAMLYINPHTSFYYRPEVHIKSDEGLNAYGAVTWGQFFIYQGFNENCGWMHTSSNADVADTYFEKISTKNGKLFYEYNQQQMPLKKEMITIKYKTNQELKTKEFQVFFTQNGPIMAQPWVSLKSYNRAKQSLVQSWLRTKATDLQSYTKIMDLRGNTSNNTVFADKKGNIAYWHGNYIPKRDTTLNWAKTQDGAIAQTGYKGLHNLDEIVSIKNPAGGWIQNCNSTPFTAAGTNSPKKNQYPSYMAPDGENFRGINAVRLLSKTQKLDLNQLIALGYDNYLPAFEILIPAFLNTPNLATTDDLKEVKTIFEKWNFRVDSTSVAATLAIEWAQKLNPSIRKIYIDQGEDDQVQNTLTFVKTAGSQELLQPMHEVITELKQNFGSFKVKWGDINRFQRLSNHLSGQFSDSRPSLAMGNASALWGCLPSFNSRKFENSIKRYGYSGNSFVCAVEFGKTITAKSLLAGGNSGDPAEKNFNSQANNFTKGIFKEVNFYEADIRKNAMKIYHPGK
jgi:acyl-homoserine-lactone acylase